MACTAPATRRNGGVGDGKWEPVSGGTELAEEQFSSMESEVDDGVVGMEQMKRRIGMERIARLTAERNFATLQRQATETLNLLMGRVRSLEHANSLLTESASKVSVLEASLASIYKAEETKLVELAACRSEALQLLVELCDEEVEDEPSTLAHHATQAWRVAAILGKNAATHRQEYERAMVATKEVFDKLEQKESLVTELEIGLNKQTQLTSELYSELSHHSTMVNTLTEANELTKNKLEQANVDLDTLNKELQRLANVSFQAEERAETAEQCVVEADKRVMEADKRVMEADKRVMEAEKRAETAEQCVVEADKRVMEAEKRAETAEQCVVEADKRVMEAEKRAETAEQCVVEADKRVMEAEKRAETAEQCVVEADKRVMEAEKRAETAEQCVVEADKRVMEADKRVMEAEKRAETAEQCVVEADKRVMEAEKRAETAEQCVVEADKRVVEADKRVMEADKRVMEAEKRAETAEQCVMEADKRVVDAESSIQATQLQIDEENHSIEIAKSQFAEDSAEQRAIAEVIIKDLEERLQNMESNRVELIQSLENAEQLYSSTNDDLINLRKEFSEKQSELDILLERCTTTDTENLQLKGQVKDLEERLQQMEERVIELESRLQNLAQQLDDARSKNSKVEASNEVTETETSESFHLKTKNAESSYLSSPKGASQTNLTVSCPTTPMAESVTTSSGALLSPALTHRTLHAYLSQTAGRVERLVGELSSLRIALANSTKEASEWRRRCEDLDKLNRIQANDLEAAKIREKRIAGMRRGLERLAVLSHSVLGATAGAALLGSNTQKIGDAAEYSEDLSELQNGLNEVHNTLTSRLQALANEFDTLCATSESNYKTEHFEELESQGILIEGESRDVIALCGRLLALHAELDERGATVERLSRELQDVITANEVMRVALGEATSREAIVAADASVDVEHDRLAVYDMDCSMNGSNLFLTGLTKDMQNCADDAALADAGLELAPDDAVDDELEEVTCSTLTDSMVSSTDSDIADSAAPATGRDLTLSLDLRARLRSLQTNLAELAGNDEVNGAVMSLASPLPAMAFSATLESLTEDVARLNAQVAAYEDRMVNGSKIATSDCSPDADVVPKEHVRALLWNYFRGSHAEAMEDAAKQLVSLVGLTSRKQASLSELMCQLAPTVAAYATFAEGAEDFERSFALSNSSRCS